MTAFWIRLCRCERLTLYIQVHYGLHDEIKGQIIATIRSLKQIKTVYVWIKNDVDVTEEYELRLKCQTKHRKGIANVRHVYLYVYHVYLRLQTNPEQSPINKIHMIVSIQISY